MSRIPLFRGVLPIRNEGLVKDVFAGITLAALGIPEVMRWRTINRISNV